MLICTTWKARPLSPEQSTRMLEVWARAEARTEAAGGSTPLFWYLNADGSGGVTVIEVDDFEAAATAGLEASLALGEFLEIESKIVVDRDSAMPAILGAQTLIAG